ncbi:MAG: phospho-N-acetylmuramoyl-pentapeptide-transferase [Synergistaceae bacterium]|nr:phospho-N-acetylmuramoyl-pentapeptide-transferase [Synergistaceae bacterium]
MKKFLIAFSFFALSVALQYFWIKFQRHEHLTQQQKTYGVNIDVEIKSKTPSMGGVIFLVMSLVALCVNFSLDSFIFWSLPVASGLVGFVDDWLKFRTHTSEGFRSLAKLKVQLIICAVWVMLVFIRGDLRLWPGVYDAGGWLAIPLAFLMIAGTINAVNITDGLDGLAGGSFLISLAVMLLLIPVSDFNAEILIELFFMTAGFLFFNLRPAKTFMGDTGSHFLGGALAALCVINGRTLAIIPAGFIFIIEMLSSAVQIFTIRKLNKKIFLMAPLHHHYQKKGFDETAVTLRFWLVHAVGATLLALAISSV